MSTVLVREKLEEEEAQREVLEEELQRRPSSPDAVEETELGHSKIESLRIDEAKVLEEQREREVLLLVLEEHVEKVQEEQRDQLVQGELLRPRHDREAEACGTSQSRPCPRRPS